MAIEHARAHAVTKPWGVEDLRPWSSAGHDGSAIGEILYERASNGAAIPVSHFRSRYIRTMRLRTRWAWQMAKPKPGTF
jgi:hypothetical protein